MRRLTARSGADVQHPLPARKVRGADDQVCRRVLYGEAAIVEGAERRQITRAGKLQASGHPRVRRDADALAAKLFDERFFTRLERVDLYADRCSGSKRPGNGRSLFRNSEASCICLYA